MITKKDKNSTRQHRHLRVRGKITGTTVTPRLNVFRSLTQIYAQVIDDSVGHTLVSCSTLDKELKDQLAGKTKVEQAKLVGELVGKRAVAANVKSVVFDRGGYRFIGRVKAVADGAREAGLKF